MDLLIINFQLKDLGREQYEEVCKEVAPVFENIPGLISKTWLADSESNTYGGIYAFEDALALEGYLESEIFKGLGENPHFSNVSARRFEVLSEPSEVTNSPHL